MCILLSVQLLRMGLLAEFEKYILRVYMRLSIVCSVSLTQKYEFILDGNAIELVSNSAVPVQQASTVTSPVDGDFLNSIIVSGEGLTQQGGV